MSYSTSAAVLGFGVGLVQRDSCALDVKGNLGRIAGPQKPIHGRVLGQKSECLNLLLLCAL